MERTLIKDEFERNPIIAAINETRDLEEIKNFPNEIIFILSSDINNLMSIVKKLKGKSVYVHFDLIRGISNDEMGIKYISEVIKPKGIITTKANLIGIAKKSGLATIQRLFVLDSKSLEGGIISVNKVKPDAVELMPGIIPDITKKISESVEMPVITGGLIDSKKEVIDSLNAGAVSISTSCKEIWCI